MEFDRLVGMKMCLSCVFSMTFIILFVLAVMMCIGKPTSAYHYDDPLYIANEWLHSKRGNGYGHLQTTTKLFSGYDYDDPLLYEKKVSEWLDVFNEEYQHIRHEAAKVNWDYNTNITVANAERVAQQGMRRAEWMLPWRQEAKKVELHRITDPYLRRQMAFIRRGSTRTIPALTRDIIRIHSKMQEIYNTGQVCVANGSCYNGEPQLSRLMQSSQDYNELLWAWKSWRDVVGPSLRPLYSRFLDLSNEEARILGYGDMGELWRHEIDADDLERKMDALFIEVKPLYMQLHAYVRYHLRKKYGDVISKRGPLPAHLLGNMWAQQWDSLYNFVIPYPKYKIPDVTTSLRRQKYTTHRMFKLAENFFLSIGLEPMTRQFWQRSILEKPKDKRKMSCHGSATNFFDGHDYRIRMCAETTEQDLYTIHHEMGHIEYFMAYRHLPILFQDGANSAFHEAIGETIHYSVLTPGHLQRIRLLNYTPVTYEMDINFLMKQALLKIPLFPFSLIMDKWRWAVFANKISKEDFNKGWWELRIKYQGVIPPIPRSEADFDPGAKYHIPDNTPYIRYYLSSFMQVQFHEALCKFQNGGQLLSLVHHCDIYGSKVAGAKLKEMLSLGSSQPWPAILEMLTGEREVTAKPLLRYYAPLHDWLIQENTRLGNYVGWEETEYEDESSDDDDDDMEHYNELNQSPLYSN
uniref:Angiotensin-converting enzyme n=1 Tax=Strigamia maritima TaxID=126957 RepID=T1IX26_STRMM